MSFLDEFSDEFAEILAIAARGRPLVIIIDDLDRCMPDAALRIIEAMKLFLDVPGVIFLLAVDRDHVERAVASQLKVDASADDTAAARETYFEKIIQLPFVLPPASHQAATTYLRGLSRDADVVACAEILIGAPPYNPRRIKRLLAAFLMLRAFARQTTGKPPVAAVLAKLVVIQHQYRVLFDQLAADPGVLERLEAALRSGTQGALIPQDVVLVERYPTLANLFSLQVSADDSFVGVSLTDYLVLLARVVGPEDEPTAARLDPLQTAPPPPPSVVGRPALVDATVRALETSNRAALVGFPGSGKTVLASLVAQDPRIRRAYPGGLLWVSAGSADRSQLAALIADLCVRLGEERLPFADPGQAALHLGSILDRRSRTLLVVDDVDLPEVVDVFNRSRTAGLLVTSRRRNILGRGGVDIEVDLLSDEEGIEALLAGLDGRPTPDVQRLVALVGRLPLALTLLNGELRRMVRSGMSTEDSVRRLLARIADEGIVSLDDSGGAVSFSRVLGASLALLDERDRERFLELSIFSERELPLPMAMVDALWRATAGLDEKSSIRLIRELDQLSLVHINDDSSVSIHRLIMAYGRELLGPAVSSIDARLLDYMETQLLEPSRPGDGCRPWWSLPASAAFLRPHIPYHLEQAGLTDEGTALRRHPRWRELR